MLKKINTLITNHPRYTQIGAGLILALFLSTHMDNIGLYSMLMVIALASLLYPLVATKHHKSLFVLMALAPLNFTLSLLLNIPLTTLFFLPFLTYFTFEFFSKQHEEQHVLWTELVLVIFMVICLFSILRSFYIPLDGLGLRNNPHEAPFVRSIVLNIFIGTCLLMAILSGRTLKKASQIDILLKIYNIVGLSIAGVSLCAWSFNLLSLPLSGMLSRFLSDNAPLYIKEIAITRIRGTFIEPSSASRYFILLFFSLRATTASSRWIHTLLLSIPVIALILTFSRSGWMIFSAVLIILFILKTLHQPKKWWILCKLLLSILGILILITIAYYLFVPVKLFVDTMVISNFTTDEQYGLANISAAIRLGEMTAAKNIFAQYPFWGVGIGNFVFHSHLYSTYIPWITDYMGSRYTTISNSYAHILVETGLVGLSCYLMFWCLLIGNVIKIYMQRLLHADAILILNICGILFTIALHSLFFSPFFHTDWLLVGVGLALLHQDFTQKHQRNPRDMAL